MEKIESTGISGLFDWVQDKLDVQDCKDLFYDLLTKAKPQYFESVDYEYFKVTRKGDLFTLEDWPEDEV